MENKYVVVRANSTSGPFIVERNRDAPRECWSKADIAGYASTIRAAEHLAAEANDEDEDEDDEDEDEDEDEATAWRMFLLKIYQRV